MNVHGLVSGAIGSVNPFVPGTVQISTGSATGPTGRRAPTYTTFTNVPLQVQALTYKDLEQVSGLNLNGTRRAIYIYGKADGVVRSQLKGGDLITLTDGPNVGTWLIAQMLEQWPDWCKACVTLQDGS